MQSTVGIWGICVRAKRSWGSEPGHEIRQAARRPFQPAETLRNAGGKSTTGMPFSTVKYRSVIFNNVAGVKPHVRVLSTCLTIPSKTLMGSLAGDTAPGGWFVIVRGQLMITRWRRRRRGYIEHGVVQRTTAARITACQLQSAIYRVRVLSRDSDNDDYSGGGGSDDDDWGYAILVRCRFWISSAWSKRARC